MRSKGLEQLDHSLYVFARSRQFVEANSMVGLAPERFCAEPYAHAQVALSVQVRSNRRVEAEACQQSLVVGMPIGNVPRGDILYKRPDVLKLENSRIEWEVDDSWLPVLVGVREPVYRPEGVTTRLWLQMVWLQGFDQGESMRDVSERAAGFRCADWPDLGLVDLLLVEDRELVASGELCIAGLDQFRDDVVKRAPQVVYDVTEDDAEAWFFGEVIGDEPQLTPARLWVDIGERGVVRVRFAKGGHELVFQDSTVLRRPCDLCVGRPKIERHGGAGIK